MDVKHSKSESEAETETEVKTDAETSLGQEKVEEGQYEGKKKVKRRRMLIRRHLKFNFLACYHLPLLMLYLERYAPGCHWPRIIDTGERDEEDDGGQSPTEKSQIYKLMGQFLLLGLCLCWQGKVQMKPWIKRSC